MRKLFFLTIFFFSFFVLKLNAQTTPVPEFKNTIQVLSNDKKSLENLEKADGRIINKVKALGFAGENYYLRLPNKKSTKLLKNTQVSFVVKMPDSTTDPNSYISLFVFETKGDKRELKIGKGNIMGMGGSKQVNIDKVSINFTKISAGNYLISLPDNLKRGNYGFALDFSNSSDFENKKVISIFAFDVE